jgi:hypothetical protein
MAELTNIFEPDFVDSLRHKVPATKNQVSGATINNSDPPDLTTRTKAEMYSRKLGIDANEAESSIVDLDKASEHINMGQRWDSIKAQFNIADLQQDVSFLAYDLMMGTDNPKALLYEIKNLERRIANEQNYVIDDNIFQKAANSAATILPPMMTTLGAGTKVGGYAALGAMSTAALLGQMGPQAALPEELVTMPVAGTTAFLAGTRAEAALITSRMEAGSAYWSLYNMTDSKGRRMDPALIGGIAQGVGAVNGLLEVAGLGVILENLPGTKQIISKLTRETVEEAVKRGVFRRLLLGYAKEYPKVIGAETAVEVAQEVTAILGEEVAKKTSNYLDGTNIPEATKEQIMSRLWDVLKTTALGMSVIAAPGPGVNVAIDSVADRRSSYADKNPSANLLPPDTHPDPGKELETAYRRAKDLFLGNRDVRIYQNRIQANLHRKQVEAVAAPAAKTTRELDLSLENLPRGEKATFDKFTSDDLPALRKAYRESLEKQRSMTLGDEKMQEVARGSLLNDAILQLEKKPELYFRGALESGPRDVTFMTTDRKMAQDYAGPQGEVYGYHVAPGTKILNYDIEGNKYLDEWMDLPENKKLGKSGDPVWAEKLRKASGEPKDSTWMPSQPEDFALFFTHAVPEFIEFLKKKGFHGYRSESYFSTEEYGTHPELAVFDKSRIRKVKLEKATRSHADKVNAAIQLYIDARPGSLVAKEAQHVIDLAKQGKSRVTQEQIELWEMSRNLTDEQKEFAKVLIDNYRQVGELGLEDGIIRNILDNYAARQWDLGLPDARQIYSTFYKNTKHARARIFKSIVHGWDAGMNLRVEGATETLLYIVM